MSNILISRFQLKNNFFVLEIKKKQITNFCQQRHRKTVSDTMEVSRNAPLTSSVNILWWSDK